MTHLDHAPVRLTLALVISCAALPSTASAQQGLASAREHYSKARFEEALDDLDAAESSQELERGELVRVLVLRGLVQYALDRTDALERTLRQLAVVEPTAELGEEAGPALVERWKAVRDEAKEPALEIEIVPGGLETTLRARARNDAELVRELAVHARVERGPWTRGRRELSVEVRPGSRVRYYAQAFGPGGVELMTLGSRQAPRVHRVPGSPVSSAPDPVAADATQPAEADGEDEGAPVGWIVGSVGLAAVVAAVVAVALVVPSDGRETQLEPSVDLP